MGLFWIMGTCSEHFLHGGHSCRSFACLNFFNLFSNPVRFELLLIPIVGLWKLGHHVAWAQRKCSGYILLFIIISIRGSWSLGFCGSLFRTQFPHSQLQPSLKDPISSKSWNQHILFSFFSSCLTPVKETKARVWKGGILHLNTRSQSQWRQSSD